MVGWCCLAGPSEQRTGDIGSEEGNEGELPKKL